MIDYSKYGLAELAHAMRSTLLGRRNTFPWHPPIDVCIRAIDAAVVLAGDDPVADLSSSGRLKECPAFEELDSAWEALRVKCRTRSVNPPSCIARDHRRSLIAGHVDALDPVWRLGMVLLREHAARA